MKLTYKRTLLYVTISIYYKDRFINTRDLSKKKIFLKKTRDFEYVVLLHEMHEKHLPRQMPCMDALLAKQYENLLPRQSLIRAAIDDLYVPRSHWSHESRLWWWKQCQSMWKQKFFSSRPARRILRYINSNILLFVYK